MKKISLFFVLGSMVLLLSGCGVGQKPQPAETQQVTIPQSTDSQNAQPQSSTTTNTTNVSFAPPTYRGDYGTKTVAVTVEKIADAYPAPSANVATESVTKSVSLEPSNPPAATTAYTYAPRTTSSNYYVPPQPQTTYVRDYVTYSYPQPSYSTQFYGAQFHGAHPKYPQYSYGCPNPNVYTPPSYWCAQPMPVQQFHGVQFHGAH